MARVFVPFNINDCVRVRLTDAGRKIHREQFRRLLARLPYESGLEYTPPMEDENGWSTWQGWELMMKFGKHIRLGRVFPFEDTIEILQREAD